jgi:hypothetical protein
MFSKLLKTIFVITAYAPILLILWLVNVFSTIDKKGETKIVSFSEITISNLQNKWYFGVGFVVIVFICYLMIYLIKNKLTRNYIEIKSFKNADFNMTTLLVSYFLPCVELYKKDDIFVYIWIIIFIILVFINKKTYFYNPLMLFFGFRYYQIVTKDVEYTMISKDKLINIKQCDAYSHITDYVIFNSTIK